MRCAIYSLDDGRKLCLECWDSSIMDTGKCQPLYHEIRDYYEGMMMILEQQIPMLLVERQALNEAMEGEKDGHHHMKQQVYKDVHRASLSHRQSYNLEFYPTKSNLNGKELSIQMRQWPNRYYTSKLSKSPRRRD